MTASLTGTTASLSGLNSYIHRDKPLWNAIALIYIIGGYGSGVALIGDGQVIDESGHYNRATFRGDVGVGFMVLPV
jgi:hypothetical protein